MRMIGIGLMGFLLAGVALLLSTMNIWERAQWAVLTRVNGPQLVFETPAAIPASGENEALIVRSDPRHPIILSGFPAYQSATFNLPLNARPTSGYLQIDATFQALSGVEGVLRVSIDNVRRGEVLLHSGEVNRSLRVPLSPTDLVREQLVVSFSLQGNGLQGQCRSDAGYAAIVEIETTSSVHLTLDRPLVTIHDRVNAWGGVVRVGWPQWLDSTEQIRRLVLATKFKQQNVPTIFLDDHSQDALSTQELRDVLPKFSLNKTPSQSWPYFIAEKGANAGLRRFDNVAKWRVRVDLRNGHAMRIPAELDLHLALGHQSFDDQWAVTVTLNDRLLHQSILAQSTTHYAETVTLPSDTIEPINVIEVVAETTRTKEHDCHHQIELIAEMLPETALFASETIFTDALSILRAQLSDIGTLSLGAVSRLSAADADVASNLLAQVVPLGVALKPAQKVDILVVTPRDADILLPNADQIWFVSQDSVTRRLVIENLIPNSELSLRNVGLLIVPGGFELAEASL